MHLKLFITIERLIFGAYTIFELYVQERKNPKCFHESLTFAKLHCGDFTIKESFQKLHIMKINLMTYDQYEDSTIKFY